MFSFLTLTNNEPTDKLDDSIDVSDKCSVKKHAVNTLLGLVCSSFSFGYNPFGNHLGCIEFKF